MKRVSILKWLSIILVTLVIVSCLGIQSQIKQHTGEATELVDTSTFKPISSPLAIVNVSILSNDCTEMIDSTTVLVKNGKIEKIGKGINVTSEYMRLDGSGKYLIPGLVDTHVHLRRSKNDLLLYLANGITYISEMNGFKRHLNWRKEAKEGSLSPRIYASSTMIHSKKGFIRKVKQTFFDTNHYYTSTEKAKKAVRKFKEEGYDAIKLGSYLNPEIYHALTTEAQKQNMAVIGHLSNEVDFETLYTSGQSQLAHIEEITKKTMDDFGGMNSSNGEEYLAYLEKNADNIAQKLKEHNIVVSTTVWLMESLPKQKYDLEHFLKTVELEYENSGLVEGSRMAKGWLPGNNGYENMEVKNDPELMKRYKIFWNTYVKAIHVMGKALADNNVALIAGTDANVNGVVPGFSLHDELQSLKKMGLNTTQVLYAATVAPAHWMQSNTGEITVGYEADLVILDKNPLEDIRHTQAINAVIAGGKLLDRNELDKMLQAVKEANNRSRTVSINQFLDEENK